MAVADVVRPQQSGDAVPGDSRRCATAVRSSHVHDVGSRQGDQPRHRPLAAFRSRPVPPRNRLCGAGFGMVLPLATLIVSHSAADVLVLTGTVVIVVAAGGCRWRATCGTLPANAPDDLPAPDPALEDAGGGRDRPVLHPVGWRLGRNGGQPNERSNGRRRGRRAGRSWGGDRAGILLAERAARVRAGRGVPDGPCPAALPAGTEVPDPAGGQDDSGRPAGGDADHSRHRR